MLHKHMLETPNPGQYELPPAWSRLGTSFGPPPAKMKVLHSELIAAQRAQPGPGTYNPTYINEKKIRTKSERKSMGKAPPAGKAHPDHIKYRGTIFGQVMAK
jgi:hypothetical protein